MSFAAGLQGLKGLMYGGGGGGREEEDRKAAEADREQRKQAFHKRLRDAGSRVRLRVISRPQPPLEKRSIGVLFLIIDSLPYEEIWKSWTARQTKDVTVTFWVHAKYPERVTSRWVKQRLIKRSYRPSWGSVELMKAEVELLRCGVTESTAQRFLFASESCLPFVPLDDAADAMFRRESSWVNARSTPNNGYATQRQWDPLEHAWMPAEYIWKADQWCLLTRKHAEAVVELQRYLGEDLWALFKKVTVSDEMYIPSCLCMLGEVTPELESGSPASSGLPIERRRVTFCHWGDSSRSPETFSGMLEGKMLEAAQKEGCLVARKFGSGTVTMEAWSDVVYRQTEEDVADTNSHSAQEQEQGQQQEPPVGDDEKATDGDGKRERETAEAADDDVQGGQKRRKE